MADSTDLKLQIDITPQIAAVARSGDTIMLGFNRTMSDAELEQLREDFSGFTEATGVHIAFVEQVDSMVVARDDRDAACVAGDED